MVEERRTWMCVELVDTKALELRRLRLDLRPSERRVAGNFSNFREEGYDAVRSGLLSTWRFTDSQGVERELVTSELRFALASGSLLPSTLVWRDGMKEWQPAFTMPELATAAIAAARGPRTPSAPPGPAPKRGPLKTLLGIEAPGARMHAEPAVPKTLLGVDAAPPKPRTAAESIQAPIVVPSRNPEARTAPQTHPIGSALSDDMDPIPRAPRLPRESRIDPVDASSTPAPANVGGRPRSIPPPLPGSVHQTNKLPRRLPTPAPFQTTSQRRPTLMGFPRPPPTNDEDQTLVTNTPANLVSATRGTTVEVSTTLQSRSKPPPAPPKRSKPPAPEEPAEEKTMRAPAEARPRPKPPSPPKRSVPPAASAEATGPIPKVSPPLRSNTLQMDAVDSAAQLASSPTATPLPATAATSAVVTSSPTSSVVDAAAPMFPAAPPALAEAVPVKSASKALTPSPTAALLVKTSANTLAAPTMRSAAASDASSKTASSTDAASKDSKVVSKEASSRGEKPAFPKPVDPRKVPGETTDQLPHAKLLGAKELLATLADDSDDESNTLVRRNNSSSAPADEDRSESVPSSRRAKTLEMSLADHEDAAQSVPVPRDETSEPPRSLTDKIPPPSKTPKIDDAEEAQPSRSPRSRTGQAFQIPRRSILGASALWMLGLVTFFFVGRCSGIQRASEIVDARTGVGKALLLQALPPVSQSTALASTEPRACSVTRQPTRWAKEASKNVPFDSEASAGSMALGYAVSDKEGVGIVIDPKTGKFEEKLRKKADSAIARVSPMASSDGGFYLAPKGDKDILAVNGDKPFYVVVDKGSVGHADSADGSPTEIFHLDGDGDVAAPQILETKAASGPPSYFLAFRRGTNIYGGAFSDAFAQTAAVAAIPGSGGKVGKPKTAFNGSEVAVVFADMPEGQKKWQVRLGHAKLGTVPTETVAIDLPEGGPGGDHIAPDIVGLPDGRWLLMWTEGSSGERAIRAITLDRDFKAIGDPIALSPPGGDFGQASLGVVGTYTTVVFLQRGDDAFEMWGAVLQCG